jgi:hypothetical protein
MKHKPLLTLALVAALLSVPLSAQSTGGYRPQNGFVPNEETALKIATAVLLPVYGDKLILSPGAFRVSLKKDFWTVQGHLNCKAPECAGDTVEVEVARYGGAIVSILPSIPPGGESVPNEETALKIAEAVLAPVYGEKKILSERPFTATLEGDLWSVEGTLPCPASRRCSGGVAMVKISRKSGEVLFMIHGK